MRNLATIILFALLFGSHALVAQQRPLAGPVQDMRENIGFERIGEYHLGPTGAKGWMHVSANFMTAEARQILITDVAPGSPADGVLQVGDLILGTNGTHFADDARKALGAAIDGAEKGGLLKLTRWRPVEGVKPRSGKEATVELTLKITGTYADTAPYDCPKTEKIMQAALAHLVAREDWGKFGDKALALLATGEKENVKLVRDYLHRAEWAKPEIKISLESGGLVCWGVGYRNLLLTEYYLATGDDYVLPAIREHAVKTAMGQSSGGTWGHGFAWKSKNDGKIHGRLGGYGALNQAGLPCFLSLILAKKCGIDHPEIDTAIDRAGRFFRSFVGKGSIGYGFHRPSLEINANGRNGMSGNGKNAIGAIAFRLLDDKRSTQFFAKLTASLHHTCEYGHSGNSYSYFWDALGANCAGSANAAAFLRELRWYHTLTRQTDGSFAYQQLGGIYGSGFLDPTVARVLIGCLPRKALFITGKEMDKSFRIEGGEVRETLAASRWRHADPEKLDPAGLIGALDNWSPIAREWIAKALGKKEGDFTARLIELLKSDKPEARAGACAALGYQGEKSAEAVPLIAKALEDDAIVAMSASYALARINKPAGKALPQMLQAMLATEEEGLMRPVQQAMAFAFGYAPGRVAPLYFDGLLPGLAGNGNPLDGLDRGILYPAIGKLLKDPGGRTRGCAAYAFTHFTRDDLAAMAQEVYDAVKEPAHHYLMFDDQARQYGLDLMLKHRIAEGLPLCLESMDLDRWGKGTRLEHRFALLRGYGGSAKSILPELRGLRVKFKSDTERAAFEEVIRSVEQGDPGRPLVSLHTLVDEQLARDLAVVEDDQLRVQICRAQMTQRVDEPFYQAACLRRIVAILGAGAKSDVAAALESENEILQKAASRLSSDETPLCIITYNIRQDTKGDQGAKDWPQRKDKVTGYLLESKSSIIGLQEVRHRQLLDVDRALPDHGYVGVGREDGKTAGEYSPIFYDRRIWKLDPEEHGTYWLSDTPTVANSRSWGNRYTRICTWARLIGTNGSQKGRAIYLYNTHWDHQSQPAREASAKLMLKTIKARAHQEDPFILMGDLNATTENPAVKHLLESGLLTDHSGKEQMRSSSKWQRDLVPGLRIDHLFTSSSLGEAQVKVEANAGVDDHSASDHHPVRLSLAAAAPLKRYLYMTSPDGAQQQGRSGTGILIFDIDDDHKFVKRIEMPIFKETLRGFTGCTKTGKLYYSTHQGTLGCFDPETEKTVWESKFKMGCDRSCITPDGKRIYVPTGWWFRTGDSGFIVVDASNGEKIDHIKVGKQAHNSIASPDGQFVYLGTETKLTQFRAEDGHPVQEISPVGESGVFPYCVDGRNHWAFVCLGKHVGVDVVDLKEGKITSRLFATDPETGRKIKHRTHGAGMTPDETELWISDQDGKRLFVFDITTRPPEAKGHVNLSMGGHGWITFSLDGRYAYSHTPDVFDVKTKKKVATFKTPDGKEFASSKFIEVQMRNGKVERISNEFGLGRIGPGQ